MALNRKTFKKAAAGAAADTNLPSGYFNTVTYTGNGGTQRIGGYINRGAIFNGSSSVIQASGLNQFFNNWNDTSWSAWINTTDTSSQFIACSSTDSQNYKLLGDITSNKFRVLVRKSSTVYVGASTTDINDGNWHHIAASYDNSTGTVKGYVDGSEEISFTTGGSSSATFSVYDFCIGANKQGSNVYNPLDGKIDQVRIFNKALSSSEVTTLYGETHASTTKSTTDIFSDNSGVALYQLDGNANDTGGVSGYIGEGAIFNGSSSKIDLPNFMPSGNASRSVSMWINTTQTTAATLLQYGGGNTNLLFNLRINDGGAGGGANTIGIGFYANDFNRPATGLMDGDWHHIAATYDGTNARIYIDGVQTGADFATGGVNTTASSGLIGSNGGSFIFNGKIDQVRIYSKELSSSEVTTLYGETASSNITISDLVAYYPMEGTSLDQEGSYHGTDTNVEYNYRGTASNVAYQDATNFSPDLVWIKNRDTVVDHALIDSVRGATEVLRSNQTTAETTRSDSLTSFDSNGFALGSDGVWWTNKSGDNYVAWCFKGGGAAVAAAGTNLTNRLVSANPDAGFSIMTYTGSTSDGTIEHGLNAKPELWIFKNLSAAKPWFTLTNIIDGSVDYGFLNTTDAFNNAGQGDATDTILNVNLDGGSGFLNANGQNYVAYAFHSVDGIQKVGSYTSQYPNTTHVETGFEPAFVMIKSYNQARNWAIHDNKRKVTNSDQRQLYANLSSAEADINDQIEFTSNGFTVKGGSNDLDGGSSYSYIYLAIAADPDTTTPTVENSFEVVTYTGNGGTQSIDVGFKPDFVWLKNGDTSNFHALVNSVVGENYIQYTNSTSAGETNSAIVTSLDSNGFTVGAEPTSNGSGNEIVAYAWKAGDHDDSLPQINTEGTIDSVVSVNDAAGFSIVKGTAISSGAFTVGHGLSSAPELYIIKRTDGTGGWQTYVESLGANKYLELNSTAAAGTSTLFWNNTAPTSTVFSMYASQVIAGGAEFIAYCFTSITGYQKVGSYQGTGATGNAVTTGFSPKFVMIKDTTNGGNWIIHSKPPTTTNPSTKHLRPNSSAGYDSGAGEQINFDSNGFTIVGTGGNVNTNNDVYLYLAIA